MRGAGARIGRVDQAEVRERVDDRRVADVERARILVLAAFERDRRAADRAHVLGRADAVGRIEVEHGVGKRGGELAPARDPGGVGREPAVDDATDAEPQRQRLFARRLGERLERPGVVARADEDERHAGRAERVQVEQDLVLGEQRTEPVGDVVLVLARRRRRLQLAVEVAVAGAALLGVRERIRHRHEGHPALDERQRAGVELGDDALDRARAADLVAVHRAEDDEARSRLRAHVGDRLERMHGRRLSEERPAAARGRARASPRASGRGSR